MPYSLVHRLTVGLIIVAAIISITGSFVVTESIVPLPVRIFQTAIAGAFWGFMALKVWKRPRTWSLGVGLVVAFMLIFQSYLWFNAATDTGTRMPGEHHSILQLIFFRVPLLLVSVFCFWLRRLSVKAG
jgi:hypothetical protein